METAARQRRCAPLRHDCRESTNGVPILPPYPELALLLAGLCNGLDQLFRKSEELGVLSRLVCSARAADQRTGGCLQFPAFAPAIALK